MLHKKSCVMQKVEIERMNDFVFVAAEQEEKIGVLMNEDQPGAKVINIIA
jgi:hypothetical protein